MDQTIRNQAATGAPLTGQPYATTNVAAATTAPLSGYGTTTTTGAGAPYGTTAAGPRTAANTAPLSGYGTTTATTNAPLSGYGTTTATTAPLSGYGTTAATTGPLSGYGTTTAGPLSDYGTTTATTGPVSGYGTTTATATGPLSGYGTTTAHLSGYGTTTPTTATSTNPLAGLMKPTPGSAYGGSGSGLSSQKILTTATAAVVPKVEQNLAARFLGGGDGRRGGGRGTVARLAGDGRSTRGTGMSDDTELSRRILETHASDDRGLAVKPVLNIIEVIFHRATADLPGFIQQLDDASDEKVLFSAASLQDYVEIPARITSSISCEIFSKCSSGVDVHTIVIDILNLIKHYSWDSKAVLALAAFAVTFGEFRLLLQLYSTNPLAKALSLLKQLPELIEHAAALRPKLDALHTLIVEIVDVTNKIVDFYDLPKEYFTAESPEILAGVSHIPTAVYWTIRSIVVSATQILSLTGMGIEYLTEPWELSSLAHKLNNIKSHLVDIIDRCLRSIEKNKEDQLFEMFNHIFSTSHIDTSRPLKVLFKEDQQVQPLYDCYTKKRISVEDLRRKVVALFITDMDPELTRSSEFAILQQMFMEKRHSGTRPESQYEVIWIPVTDVWTEEKLRRFEAARAEMEWHSVYHPSAIHPVAARFFREKWGFNKKPMLVVMDQQGRIVHHNAIHMMCIWGSVAYPFTLAREKMLWDEMSWTIDLLADNLEPDMATWIQEGRYICLYGGDDIEWIRKFTRKAKEVALESGITLELLYAGKSKPKEKVTRSIIDQITKEGLSRTLDWNLIEFFWLRLESMWHSKGQFAKSDLTSTAAGAGAAAKTDPIMLGIIAMLSYGSSGQGWAVFSQGFSEMVKGNGEQMHNVLLNHAKWLGRESEVGFFQALEEHLTQINPDTPHHCTSLILPATGAMPEAVACAECGRLMERFTMFRCCLD